MKLLSFGHTNYKVIFFKLQEEKYKPQDTADILETIFTLILGYAYQLNQSKRLIE